MSKCIKCQTEFEQKRKTQKFCSVKCRNVFNVEKHRINHNLHPGKVGRPGHVWIALNDMTDSDWDKFNKNVIKY